MDQNSILALPILIFFLFPTVNSEAEDVNQALVRFMEKLSAGKAPRDQNWGWNTSSDPCNDKWIGVTCDKSQQSVRRIVLDEFNLSGILDASAVCNAKSLIVLSLESNYVVGTLTKEISNCKHLTHLYVRGNKLSGNLPDSLPQLNNLKRLDISNNNFSDELPDLSRISGLLTFYAENNQLRGEIPEFDFSNLLQFNVSNNHLSGPIPDVKGRFGADCFSGNPGLCGKPMSNDCPPIPPPRKKSKGSTSQVLLFSGYITLGLFVLLLVALKIVRKKKPKEEKTDVLMNEVAVDTTSNKTSSTSSGHRTDENRSEYSITSAKRRMSSSSLVVLTSPEVQRLTFEDLLRAPAELLGRGKHGSFYKVMLEDGMILAVKRLRDWGISSEEFEKRSQKLGKMKHPNVLAPVAYYCSKQEKLLVYEFQPNGSLFKLLHGSQNGQSFDWGSRLGVAASVAKALALMHGELCEEGIAHGDLKSTNILFNKKMEPCISEYGLITTESQDQSFLTQTSSFKINDLSSQTWNAFKIDVYGFGVIILELLTGKLVQTNGFNLANWVNSVVREEWTVEVFDKALITEGASEERMVNLLMVALKCINPSPNERPSTNQVAFMIDTIKEEEERSISLEA